MKTVHQLFVRLHLERVRSLPRRNENIFSPHLTTSPLLSSEAYLEGMKTKHSRLLFGHIAQSEAYLEGMKTITFRPSYSTSSIPSEAYLEGMKTWLARA